jgi:hypothetical protein
MNPYSAMSEELEKIAFDTKHKALAIGASTGAGLMGLHRGLKEWDDREKEKWGPTDKNRSLKRKRRLLRHAVSVGVGAAGGATLGRLGHSGYETLKKALEQGGEEFRKGVHAGTKGGVTEAIEGVDIPGKLERGIKAGLPTLNPVTHLKNLAARFRKTKKK